MGKRQKRQNGFAAIEALLIAVIIGIVGFTGWYVLNAKKNTDKSLSSNNSSTPVIKKNPKTSTTIQSSGTDSQKQETWACIARADAVEKFPRPAEQRTTIRCKSLG